MRRSILDSDKPVYIMARFLIGVVFGILPDIVIVLYAIDYNRNNLFMLDDWLPWTLICVPLMCGALSVLCLKEILIYVGAAAENFRE